MAYLYKIFPEYTDVLVVAAHPDDETIGMGGTISRMVRQGLNVHVVIMADGSGDVRGVPKERRPRNREEIKAEAESGFTSPGWGNCHRAAMALGYSTLCVYGLADSRFDSLDILDLAKLVEKHIELIRPQVVFTQSPCDLSIDHRRTGEAVITACRPKPDHPVKEVYFFETASATEWAVNPMMPPFIPNVFIDIHEDEEIRESALMAYKAEITKPPHPRSIDGLSYLSYWRGYTAGLQAAEAFMTARRVLP